MKRILFAIVVMLLLPVSVAAQVTVGVQADHDGFCTTSYQLFDGTTSLGTVVKTTPFNGTVTFGTVALPSGTRLLTMTAIGFELASLPGTAAVAGTVSVTQASTAVTGIGTSFTTEYAAGAAIWIGLAPYKVASVTSATALVLATPYTGITVTGLSVFKASAGAPPTCSTKVSMSAKSTTLSYVVPVATIPLKPPTNLRAIIGGIIGGN